MDQELVERARTLLDLCRTKGLTIAAAESCTGGLLAATLTEIAGSSDVFERGFVTYSNEAKQAMVGVTSATLASHGAVSRETAEAMASGALAHAPVHLAVSITGIAGPGGAVPGKPVGLVHLHAETPEAGHGIEFGFPSDRETVRSRATVAALHLLRRLLSQNPDIRV